MCVCVCVCVCVRARARACVCVCACARACVCDENPCRPRREFQFVCIRNTYHFVALMLRSGGVSLWRGTSKATEWWGVRAMRMGGSSSPYEEFVGYDWSPPLRTPPRSVATKTPIVTNDTGFVGQAGRTAPCFVCLRTAKFAFAGPRISVQFLRKPTCAPPDAVQELTGAARYLDKNAGPSRPGK